MTTQTLTIRAQKFVNTLASSLEDWGLDADTEVTIFGDGSCQALIDDQVQALDPDGKWAADIRRAWPLDGD